MVKIGVIGAGGIANGIHLPALKEIRNCEVAAVCDLRVERARATAEKFNIPAHYALSHEMIKNENLDGVVCLVEPDRMYRVAYECLDAGLPVLMEKPPGLDAYQARSLARKAKKENLCAAVAMNRRHVPVVQRAIKRVRELTVVNQVDGVFIKNGAIDETWHYASAFVCDIVHAVDLMRYMAGSEPVKAATVIAMIDSPVDNAWSSVMRFGNGVTGTLKSNYKTGGRVHSFEMHGPGASAFINLGFGDQSCDAKIIHSGGGMYSMSSGGVGEQHVEYIDGVAEAGGNKYYQYYGYKQEDAEFIECIATGRKPLCDIEDAVKTMEAVELLLNSAL